MMCLTLLFPVQLRQGNEYVNGWMQTKVVLHVLDEKDNAAAGLTPFLRHLDSFRGSGGSLQRRCIQVRVNTVMLSMNLRLLQEMSGM